MTTAVTTGSIGQRRSVENTKFANDASLESVDLMLKKLSKKCLARVAAMGVSMDFDDILQEMYMGYIRAQQAWKPDGRSLFSTYCQTVCLNNFNAAIKKMERERAVGRVPMRLCGPTGKMVEPKWQRQFGLMTQSELGSDDRGEFFIAIENTEGPEADTPGYRLERSQEMTAKLEALSPGAKRLVALLLDDELRSSGEIPKLRTLARIAQLEGAELKRVKIEILKTFGVAW